MWACTERWEHLQNQNNLASKPFLSRLRENLKFSHVYLKQNDMIWPQSLASQVPAFPFQSFSLTFRSQIQRTRSNNIPVLRVDLSSHFSFLSAYPACYPSNSGQWLGSYLGRCSVETYHLDYELSKVLRNISRTTGLLYS